MSYLVYSLSDHARQIFGARATGLALLFPLVLISMHRLYFCASRGNASSPIRNLMSDRCAAIATALYVLGVLSVLFVPQIGQGLELLFD